MSNNTSLTAIIAELGFLSESELGEVQARQVIYGGDQETNLLELGAVSEAELLTALEKFTGLQQAPEGYLRIDLSLSKRAAKVGASLVAGASEDQRPTVFTSEPLDAQMTAELGEEFGTALLFRAAPRLRVVEAKSAMGLGKLTVRETGLLDRLGPRPAEAPLSTVDEESDEEPAPTSDSSTAVPPEVQEAPPTRLPEVEIAPDKSNASGAPDAVDNAENAPDHPSASEIPNSVATGTLEPAPARQSSLMTKHSPVAVETGPPPQGYEQLTAASHQKSAEVRASRSGPRLKYSTPEAIADLNSAKTRDRVIDVLIHYAAQFFEYTAVFAVLSKVAKGLSATGQGTRTDELKKLKIPLDLPSAFHNAQHSTAPQVARLKASGLEGGIARDLDRPTGREILLLPIGVRGRSILLLWGDRGKEGVDYQGVSELLSFAPAVSLALERVLLEHVRASRVASPSGPPSGSLHKPVVPAQTAPTPVPVPRSQGAPVAKAPSTERNPAAPAAQPPNMGSGLEVARAQKRAFGEKRSPSEHPESGHSEPPMHFPADSPKTIRGFPRVNNPRDVITSFETREEAPVPKKPSLHPPLMSRRIVPLDSVVRIQSDPPMAPDNPVDVPNIAPAPPPLDMGLSTHDDVPRHSSRGTLMSRRPPVYEPSEDGWGSDGSSPDVQVPPLGGLSANRGKSSDDLVHRLLKGDESVIARLVERGETAVGALIAEFPGPVREPKDPNVPASECGPILKALVALGSKATPFLTVRTADEDASVRRWATFVLGELPGKDAAKAIAGRLLDDSAEVRRAALASARRARRDTLTRRTLRSQMEELCRDTVLSTESRAASIEALADIREHEAIPTLLQLLDDGDSAVVRAARWALSVLTRQDFGTDTDAWKRFWQENRDLDRVEWLISSLAHDQRDLRRAAGEELKALAGEDFGFNEDLPEAERRLAQAEFRRWWTTKGKGAAR